MQKHHRNLEFQSYTTEYITENDELGVGHSNILPQPMSDLISHTTRLFSYF